MGSSKKIAYWLEATGRDQISIKTGNFGQKVCHYTLIIVKYSLLPSGRYIAVNKRMTLML
jgi:hypothetical protein